MAITRNNTTITHRDGATVCTLHSTDIVKLEAGNITLNSGGWETVTTKRRMNEVLKEWGLPYSVHQKDFRWFVYDHETKAELPYYDGMMLSAL